MTAVTPPDVVQPLGDAERHGVLDHLRLVGAVHRKGDRRVGRDDGAIVVELDAHPPAQSLHVSDESVHLIQRQPYLGRQERRPRSFGAQGAEPFLPLAVGDFCRRFLAARPLDDLGQALDLPVDLFGAALKIDRQRGAVAEGGIARLLQQAVETDTAVVHVVGAQVALRQCHRRLAQRRLVGEGDQVVGLGLWRATHLEFELGEDAQGPLRTGEPGQRRVRVGSDLGDLAVGQDDVGSHHLLVYAAEGEAADAIPLGAEPSADGARGSAGGVGQHGPPPVAQPVVQLGPADGRGHSHRPACFVEYRLTPHIVQIQQDAAAVRDRVKVDSRGRGARCDRDVMAAGVLHHDRDFVGADRARDQIRFRPDAERRHQ